MTNATITIWIIAIAMLFFAWRRKDGGHTRGVMQGWATAKRNFWTLLMAFVIVGFVNVFAPQNLIRDYLGPDSGWGGILLAEGIGIILPGGPYVVFPIMGVIYHAGAGLAPAVTLVTSWASLALLTVTFEIPFMGWRFSVIRWGLGLLAPLLAGAVVMLLL
jgi:uncharacterized membrane protein YraQ (UPF0718 family)